MLHSLEQKSSSWSGSSLLRKVKQMYREVREKGMRPPVLALSSTVSVTEQDLSVLFCKMRGTDWTLRGGCDSNLRYMLVLKGNLDPVPCLHVCVCWMLGDEPQGRGWAGVSPCPGPRLKI